MNAWKLLAGAAMVLAMAGSASAAISARIVEEGALRAGPDYDYPVVAWVDDGDDARLEGCLRSQDWCEVQVYSRSWNEWERGWLPAWAVQRIDRYNRWYWQDDNFWYALPFLTFDGWLYWDRHYRTTPWYRNDRRWFDQTYPYWRHTRPGQYRDERWRNQRGWDHDEHRRNRDHRRDWDNRNNGRDWERNRERDRRGWDSRNHDNQEHRNWDSRNQRTVPQANQQPETWNGREHPVPRTTPRPEARPDNRGGRAWDPGSGYPGAGQPGQAQPEPRQDWNRGGRENVRGAGRTENPGTRAWEEPSPVRRVGRDNSQPRQAPVTHPSQGTYERREQEQRMEQRRDNRQYDKQDDHRRQEP